MRVGIGLGAGYGHVLQGGHGSAIGGDFFLEPNVFVQAKAMRLSGRWLFFEELNRVSDATGRLLGTTSASYLFLELGIEFDR